MKVFVTGATGYIGGSVAERLVGSGHEVLGLVRSEEKALLLERRGIQPVLGTLDDAEILSNAAHAAEVVIHAASADNPYGVETLVAALERSGKLLIHTSGSSIVADDADGEYASSVVFTEDTYFEPVPFRRPRVELNRHVRQAGIDRGIRATVICPPMIYGTGRGLQPDSDQIPKLTALSKQLGAGVYFGKGLNRYSNVHIEDLVDLSMISRSLGFGGKTISLSVDDLVRQYGEAVRYGVASNSRVRAVNARRLGWSPKAPSLRETLEEEH